jgi:hypothetical protein
MGIVQHDEDAGDINTIEVIAFVHAKSPRSGPLSTQSTAVQVTPPDTTARPSWLGADRGLVKNGRHDLSLPERPDTSLCRRRSHRSYWYVECVHETGRLTG